MWNGRIPMEGVEAGVQNTFILCYSKESSQDTNDNISGASQK